MKLSIITINYNNAEGLRKTLASVAAQTYADIEHIIVDGGSTDRSVEIIREYADNEAIRLQGYTAIRQEENGKADLHHDIGEFECHKLCCSTRLAQCGEWDCARNIEKDDCCDNYHILRMGNICLTHQCSATIG